MAKLVNLLRWKKAVTLLDADGSPAKDEDGNNAVYWIRIIGDEDQQDAYRQARIKSAQMRAKFRDETSSEYLDQIDPIKEAERDICEQIILAAKGSDFTSEALATVERPELPELGEVAIDADAPTLEEQEKFDAAVRQVEEEYQKALADHIKDKTEALKGELASMDMDTLRDAAKIATINALCLGEFLTVVKDEKVWRAVYEDEKCKVHALDSLEEFNELQPIIKQQLRDAYSMLEVSPDEIKN